jgi:hypothetical protein
VKVESGFVSRNRWLLGGLTCLLGACLLAAGAIPGKPPKDTGFGVFTADGSFATLAGFTVLAIALERFCEAVLAPWWAKTGASDVKTQAKTAGGKVDASAKPMLLGASDLKKIAVHGRALAAALGAEALTGDLAEDAKKKEEEKEAATKAADEADSAWVKVTRDRPTIVLPAAAIATVACAHLHLFLLHGISKTGAGVVGVPTTELAYVIDALITGLALAGGAKPFHDVVESIAAKKDAAVATAASSSAASGPAAGARP